MAARLLTLAAPAKLNLDLRVFDRRDDGLHEIDSVMTPLDFGDVVSVSVRADGKLSRKWSHPQVRNDLAMRAARLLKAETGASGGADIVVHKRIPVGGGLGGGSSNAATVLRALNSLWQTGLKKQELATLALRLGADVPFFIFGRPARVRGAGERLSAAKSPFLQKYKHYVLLFPGVVSHTAAAYRQRENLTSGRVKRKITNVVIDNTNDLAAAVFYLHPEVASAARLLRRVAGEARLSGSGSCLFAAFDSRAAAESAKTKLPKSAAAAVASSVSSVSQLKVAADAKILSPMRNAG